MVASRINMPGDELSFIAARQPEEACLHRVCAKKALMEGRLAWRASEDKSSGTATRVSETPIAKLIQLCVTRA